MVCVSAGLLFALALVVADHTWPGGLPAVIGCAAGVDRYNHNLNTTAGVYPDICTTHSHDDRLSTAAVVKESELSLCAGLIVGMGESLTQRAGLIAQLAALDPQPESVPINLLVQVEGTPLANTAALDPLEFLATGGQ